MTTPTTEHELNQMGLRDLQSRFREVVGEETRCPNKTFLVRRILAALAAQQTNDTVSANMEVEAPSTSGSPTPEPEATAPPESERRPTQPAIEAAVAAPPDAEPTSAEPLADGAAIDPTSTEAIATASAAEPTSDQPVAAEPSVSQPFAEELPSTEPPVLADTSAEPEEEAPATVIEPAPVTEAIPPRLALADEAPPDKLPLSAPASDAFDDGLANDAVEEVPASGTAEEAPAGDSAEGTSAQLAPSTSAPAAAPSTQPTRGRRGRFRDMTVEQLQALYLATVGRSSGSTDRRYLEWKIREAEKGRIPVGPREPRATAATTEASDDIRVLPLRLDGAAVDALDATWKSHGMKSRMDFFRRALGHYLAHLGANGAAMHFASQSAE
ncbi:MAG: hypothetical protein MUF64_31885 [Polyangiaceae bacterium]|jgi:hypothetical protein|nr:hypothetical protein [Polyangiaceae bacterium]